MFWASTIVEHRSETLTSFYGRSPAAWLQSSSATSSWNCYPFSILAINYHKLIEDSNELSFVYESNRGVALFIEFGLDLLSAHVNDIINFL